LGVNLKRFGGREVGYTDSEQGRHPHFSERYHVSVLSTEPVATRGLHWK